jgi:hypothetical protein
MKDSKQTDNTYFQDVRGEFNHKIVVELKTEVNPAYVTNRI